MSRRNVALAVGVLALTPTLITHLFLLGIEQRLNVRIHRKPVLVALPGFFTLKQASLEWGQKFRVNAGTLSVRFPLTAVLGFRFPLVLRGRDLSVEFGPEWVQAVGQKNVFFDSVNAELMVGGPSGFDINSLDAESKTVQFHLRGH